MIKLNIFILLLFANSLFAQIAPEYDKFEFYQSGIKKVTISQCNYDLQEKDFTTFYELVLTKDGLLDSSVLNPNPTLIPNTVTKYKYNKSILTQNWVITENKWKANVFENSMIDYYDANSLLLDSNVRINNFATTLSYFSYDKNKNLLKSFTLSENKDTMYRHYAYYSKERLDSVYAETVYAKRREYYTYTNDTVFKTNYSFYNQYDTTVYRYGRIYRDDKLIQFMRLDDKNEKIEVSLYEYNSEGRLIKMSTYSNPIKCAHRDYTSVQPDKVTKYTYSYE